MTSVDPAASSVHRRVRPLVVVAVALGALALVAPAACNGDDGAGDAPAPTAPTAAADDEPRPDEGPDDDEDGGSDAPDAVDSEATSPTTEPLPDDATVYEGDLDGLDGASITFGAVDGTIPSFTLSGLTVECFPLEGNAEVRSRTVDVTMTDIEVGPEGIVEHGEPDQPWSPLLVGTFTDDGEFAGNLEVNRQGDDAVCGGEFTFTAAGS